LFYPSCISSELSANNISEVISVKARDGMKSQIQEQEQQNHDKFNSITQKTAPENQNQTHNSRKEGIQPINQKR
jgi:hypothetical protein